jgi:hypothetical protein
MSAVRPRTIDEALAQFTLIAGAGSEKFKQACAMTLLAWVAGREWTDAPECAHPIIRNAVIHVNDAAGTTPEMREQIVRAGETGILDTWWIPMQVVALAFALETGGEKISEYDRLLRALNRIAKWKLDKGLPPSLAGADLAGANLAGAYLAGANLAGANLAGANLAGANLAGAYLARADLTGANLAGAYLADANLAGANLADAYLARAYLAGANLAGAYLADADLTGANLAGAYLARANLAGAYLADAKGTPRSGMPFGWALTGAGLWVRS